MSLDPLQPLTEALVHERNLHEDIGSRWKELARNLGFKRVVVEAIQNENQKESERSFHLLVRWIEREGQEGATAGKLADALKKTELKNLAERLIGPSNGRRTILIEITGTFELDDGNEVMLGIDCFGKTIYFMWPESEGKEFKTSPEELKKCVDASSHIAAEIVEITGEVDASAEKANNGFTEEEQRIFSHLKDLQGKLMDIVKSLEISELKEDNFARTNKLDFIEKNSRTLQELYTKVTGMTREACYCNYILRRTFYDFTYHSLRSVHNDLSARLQDLESEEDDMSEEEKRNLKNLISYQNGRKNQIMQLEKLWIRLFSPGDELKKSETSPSQRQTPIPFQKPRSSTEGARPKEFITKVQSRIPWKKKKIQDKESCVLMSYQDKKSEDEK